MTQSCAPGKVILFGEHAVVYGRPAIAVPVTEVQATATVDESRARPGVTIRADDIGFTGDAAIDLATAAAHEPLSATVRNTLAHLGVDPDQVRLTLSVRSTIPIASGLGSGAAVATAIVRALSEHLGHPFDASTVSSIVYETEKIHHGTPSGIDNTVVAFERPVYYCRDRPIETFSVPRPFWIAIGDTGVPSLTRETVADVRAAWRRAPETCERIFDRIARLVDAAREAIEERRIESLGPLMDGNQRLLRQLEVSSPELETLIDAALRQGAKGAKLCGGGRGGNMIALIEQESAERVRRALLGAGAKGVIVSKVGRDGLS